MKSDILLYFATAIGSAAGCLQTVGSISNTDPRAPKLRTAYVIDNGKAVCDAARGVRDYSAHTWDVTCTQPYRLQVSKDGNAVWYTAPSGVFHWGHNFAADQKLKDWNEWHFC
ncbi:hypothetical protein NLG97_g3108 [Lecanicillium saksenae]|uniref:Uncharacterized protein n=1 Tax=Lecanicillium saksenae TaxID=468837 RepID=A0ACC1R0T5_9HYPO|nr:hypothetical protein NLG97_g3108 [Lecanicillium saksenae]